MSAGFTLPVRWRVFGAAVAVVFAIAIWYRVTAPPADPPARSSSVRSIAVLPFMNASSDSAYDYLGEGIGGDLTGILGRIHGLRVAGSRSAAALAGEDPVSIGRRLRVGAVLLGTIRPVSDRLRLSVHLVSVDGGFDIWSEAYERSDANLFGVERDIVTEIVAALRLRDGPRAPAPDPPALRAAPGAHEATLEGTYRLRRAAPGSTDYAAAGFERAISLDSSYAPAWAGASEAYLRDFLSESSPPEDAIPRARRAAERAIALDSTMAEPRIARAIIRLLHDRDPAKAGADLDRAVEINPSLPEAWDWQAYRWIAQGRTDSAVSAARRAVDLSPLDATLRAHLGWQYRLAGQDSLATLAFARASALDSLAVPSPFPLLPSPSYDSLLAAAKDHYVSPYTLAVAAVVSGKTDEAVAAFARALAERTPWMIYAHFDPRLAALRGNRRFEALLARLPQTTIPTRP